MTKSIISKKLPPYLIPIRYLYRKIAEYAFRSVRLAQVNKGGVRYLLWANEDIGKRMIFQRRYEDDERQAFKQLIRPGDICLDVGGNVGIFSLNFALKCGPTGHVHVIEPLRRNRLVIELAAEINGLKNISVHPYALSDREGQVTLEVPNIDGAYAFISQSAAPTDAGAVTVRCMTALKLIEELDLQRIDIWKIDVEGAENLVLDGAVELLRDRARRPRVVMIELVDEYLNRYESSTKTVLSVMNGHGYQAFYAASNGSLQPFTESDINNVFNVFFIAEA